MAQKTYNILNYGKEYKQAFLELLSDTTTRITLPDEIDGVQYSLGKERWDGDTNLEYIDFNKCDIIPPKTCNECSNLTQAVFSTHTTQIGDYAFYNCRKFEDTELPHTLTNIGEYAFYKVGSSYSQGTHTFTMIDDVGIHTTIGSSAFSSSHLSEIDAYTNDIGASAFSSCSSLLNVNLEIHGRVDGYTFQQCNNIENFTISPNSVITSLGYYVFSGLAANKPTAVIAPFDFRNSTFSTIYDGVWNNCIFNGTVYLPSTVSKIQGGFLTNARGNWAFYFLSVPSVSSSSYLRSDSSNFTVRYFFPYTLLGDAAAATNWSSHTSQIIGYGSGFKVGTTLPQYNINIGYEYFWYEDVALTTPVTISQGENIIYYCILSTGPVITYIDALVGTDAVVTLEGSDGITYSLNNRYIPINVSVTVTSSPTDPLKPNIYKIYVNGQDKTADVPVVITGNGKPLKVGVSYWDGITPPGLSWDIYTQTAEFSSSGRSNTGRGIVYNNKLYWSTGWNFGYIGTSANRYVYDPANDSVQQVASFIGKDNGTTVSTSVYMAFVNGSKIEYNMSYGNAGMPVFNTYDPTNDSMAYNNTTLFPKGKRCDGNVIHYGNYIYAVLTDQEGQTQNGQLYRFDLTTPYPYTLEQVATVSGGSLSEVIDNKIYIIGGLCPSSSPSKWSNYIGYYDLNDHLVHKCSAVLPEKYVGGGGFAMATINNKIYIFGGLTQESGLKNTILEYDPALDIITTLDVVLPVAAWGHQCGVIDGAVYLMGGQTGTGYSSSSNSDPHIYRFSH